MNYNKRFTELTEKEQNMIIESQYKKMCDEESLCLSTLDFNFSKAIDDELVKLLRKINNIEHENVSIDNNNTTNDNNNTTNNNNINNNDKNINDNNNNNNDKKEIRIIKKNHLLDVTINAVVEAFDNSPPEFSAAPKIFLNRPLPVSFRPYVWNASLLLSLKNKEQDIDINSLASILDEVIPRRCHSLLDKYYENMSSRWLAGLVTDTIMKLMQIYNIQFPKNDLDCDNIDILFFLVIPLVDVLSQGQDNRESHDTDNDYGKLLLTKDMGDKKSVTLILKALVALLSNTHMNILIPGKGLEEKSPLIARIELYLNQKDENILDILNKLIDSNGDQFDNPEWKNFFNPYLLKGLSGLVEHDICLFVWDQGYIMSFHKTLSIVFTSLLLSFRNIFENPAEPWPNSKTAFTTFCTYCMTITVSQLQKMLSLYFSEELNEEFEKGRGYTLEEDDGILIAVYKKEAPEIPSKINFEDRNQKDIDIEK